MSGRVVAYVGLGSNQQHPVRQVRDAFRALAGVPRTRLMAQSPLYKSAPLGPPDQPDFINAVAALETALPAAELLHALQAIETAHGRVRGGLRWGPRTLDLDLLLYGDAVIRTPQLQVPHPGLPERGFVLYPLADLAPALDVPGHGTVKALLAHCAPSDIELLGESADD